ncbi:hypothetical protein L873DRAFT_1217955 [Choiromyces venosus 120613-1]|uniref:Uncharacterized protein n=1 Tax=Choiromyces venosus 120613-1 TaxID=1336337 RepID=A0A3N4JE62_9PEZI|nr:hypothetical protein L873DRAFT_1217955 [Choiromyces venosus 120613-1]
MRYSIMREKRRPGYSCPDLCNTFSPFHFLHFYCTAATSNSNTDTIPVGIPHWARCRTKGALVTDTLPAFLQVPFQSCKTGVWVCCLTREGARGGGVCVCVCVWESSNQLACVCVLDVRDDRVQILMHGFCGKARIVSGIFGLIGGLGQVGFCLVRWVVYLSISVSLGFVIQLLR